MVQAVRSRATAAARCSSAVGACAVLGCLATEGGQRLIRALHGLCCAVLCCVGDWKGIRSVRAHPVRTHARTCPLLRRSVPIPPTRVISSSHSTPLTTPPPPAPTKPNPERTHPKYPPVAHHQQASRKKKYKPPTLTAPGSTLLLPRAPRPPLHGAAVDQLRRGSDQQRGAAIWVSIIGCARYCSRVRRCIP